MGRRPDGSAAGRVLANEEDIAAALRPLGFDLFYAEDYSFEEQRTIFSACEIVVAVHGAGLSNTAFMQCGAHVVELVPLSDVRWHFALLAQLCKLSYAMLPVKTSVVREGRVLLVVADPELVRQRVQQILSARTADSV